MNFFRAATAALRGIIPRQADYHIRRNQAQVVKALCSFEIYAKGDRIVSSEEFKDTKVEWENKS